jgi:hypothetical protein
MTGEGDMLDFRVTRTEIQHVPHFQIQSVP